MNIRLQLLSDLHNEFGRQKAYKWNIPETDADLIILAGDIGNGLLGVEWAIRQSERLHKPIAMVLGNHDYMAYGMELVEDAVEYCMNSNVTILQNNTLQFGEYRILGCTLWTDFEGYGPAGKVFAMHAAPSSMADYRFIKGLTPLMTTEFFAESMQWLRENLTGPKDIVVTHHAPTHYGLHPYYKDDILNPAFFSDLEGFILERQPLAWFSGHSHWCFEHHIGRTLLQANTKGYRNETTGGFDPGLVIEISN